MREKKALVKVFFGVGTDSGAKRGAGGKDVGADGAKQALFLFRCTEIRCSKKSAAGGYGMGT